MQRLIFLFVISSFLCIHAIAQERPISNKFENWTSDLLSGKIDSTEFIQKVKDLESDSSDSFANSKDHNNAMQTLLAGQVYYVNSSSPGGDGLSWSTAFQDIQSALTAASSGDEIWVASGTYKPTSTTSQTIYFTLKTGVSLYGGFSGGESSKDQRDWNNNQSILSGEIGGTGLTDNSEHVVYGSGVTNVVLNGFVIEKGYANNSNFGGGLYCSNVTNLIIENCTFRNNYSQYHGGAVYLSSTSAITINSIFHDNTTGSYDGGGYFSTGAYSKSIVSCLFYNNQSGRAGGAIENYTSTLNVVNTTVVDNIANGAYGNGLASWSGTTNIDNSIFHGNSTTIRNLSTLGGGYIYVDHSLVQFGSYTSGSNVLLDVDPLFVDRLNGNYRLSDSSPCINAGAIDTTNLDLPATDLDGQERITNGRVDMGAYEKGVDTPIQAQMDHIFGALDQSYINTGILTDYGIDLIDHTLFNGVISQENIMNMHSWRALYGSLLSSVINPSSDLVHLKTINQDLENYWATYDKDNPTIDIPVLFAAYQSLKSDAITQNLISESNGQLYDVPGRPESPYNTQYAFAAAPYLGYDEDGQATFIFRSSLFVNSSSKNFSSFQVDFGDGGGYQTLTMDSPYSVSYPTEGIKTLKFKIQFTDGSIFYSHAQFWVVSVSAASSARYAGSGAREYIFPRASDPNCPEPGFPNPRVWDGSFSGATVTVEYGDPRATTDPGCDPEFIRPLIVVEGYDPSNFSHLNVDPWAYTDFINDQTNGALNIDIDPGTPFVTFGDELESEGFDLIFIDLDQGTGDIIRNAYLLENIIQWVNDHKTGTEENVVLGQSMGGLVARYAVCDMEKRRLDDPSNNPDHEVRLLVTHDAPHRGANVPLGFQALVNELAPMKLTKIGLATYGSTGAIVGSFLELKHIVPALKQADQLLDEPASRQMLMVQDGRSNTFLDGEYRDMVTFSSGYSPSFRMIALSNGSECGEGQQFVQPGDELFYAEGNLYAHRLLINPAAEIALSTDFLNPGLGIITRAALYALTPFVGKNWKTKHEVNATPASGVNQAFYGKISFEKKILFLIPININLFEESRNSVPGALPWDSAPGGYYSLQGVQGSLPHNPNINGYPLIDVGLTVRLEEAFNFVPVVSALDIENDPVPTEALSSPFTNGTNATYPSRFANFVTQERNPNEILGSTNNSRHVQFTPRNAQWLLDEMQGLTPTNSACSYLCEGTSTSPAISGPGSVCVTNTSYTMTHVPAGATVDWTWTPNITYVSGQGTNTLIVNQGTGGIGLISGIINGGCGASDPIEKEVGVGATIPIISGPYDVNDHTTVEFTTSAPADTYEWSVTGGTIVSGQNTSSVDIKTDCIPEGEMTVGLRITNSCGISPWNYLNVGCYPEEFSSETFIYPNPAEETLSVELDKNKADSEKEIKLLNNFQHVVKEKKTEGAEIILDVRDLPAGLYYLIVNYNDSKESIHLIIN